jgi:hypothetical protein
MVDPIYCISISSPKISFNVVKTIINHLFGSVWEWFKAPIKMMTTGGWFIQNIQRIGVDISIHKKLKFVTGSLCRWAPYLSHASLEIIIPSKLFLWGCELKIKLKYCTLCFQLKIPPY